MFVKNTGKVYDTKLTIPMNCFQMGKVEVHFTNNIGEIVQLLYGRETVYSWKQKLRKIFQVFFKRKERNSTSTTIRFLIILQS